MVATFKALLEIGCIENVYLLRFCGEGKRRILLHYSRTGCVVLSRKSLTSGMALVIGAILRIPGRVEFPRIF
ncbi:hypothetical protein BH09VER1_BH09VER1_24760 [soil metagenome]